MPRITANEAIAALKRARWVQLRQVGSHAHFEHPERPGLVTVPRHAGETLYPRLLRGILDQAGLTVDGFQELLQVARYTVLLDYDPEGPGYVVTVPALPGCFTRGAAVEEALVRAREAVAGRVASLLAAGQPVPAEIASPLMAVVDVDEATAVPA